MDGATEVIWKTSVIVRNWMCELKSYIPVKKLRMAIIFLMWELLSSASADQSHKEFNELYLQEVDFYEDKYYSS